MLNQLLGNTTVPGSQPHFPSQTQARPTTPTQSYQQHAYPYQNQSTQRTPPTDVYGSPRPPLRTDRLPDKFRRERQRPATPPPNRASGPNRIRCDCVDPTCPGYYYDMAHFTTLPPTSPYGYTPSTAYDPVASYNTTRYASYTSTRHYDAAQYTPYTPTQAPRRSRINESGRCSFCDSRRCTGRCTYRFL